MGQNEYCNRCGATVSFDVGYCSKCGIKIGSHPPWKESLSKIDNLGSAHYSASSGVSEETVTSATCSMESLSALYDDVRRRIGILRNKGIPENAILPLEKDLEAIESDDKRSRHDFEEALKSGDEEGLTRVTEDIHEKLPQHYESLSNDELVGEVITAVSYCNMLLNKKGSFELFGQSMRTGHSLHGGCCNESGFAEKIGSLALLFDIPLGKIKSVLSSPKDEWKSIRLVEEWCKEKGIKVPADVFETWRRIKKLRNCTHPFHPESSDFIESVEYFDGGFPPDYESLWRSILNRFLGSLNLFQEALSS